MPEPLADFAQLLQFNTPTRIEGRLLTFDTYDDAIWVELTHWFQDGGWVVVKNEAHLLLYPRDADMMRWFRAMKTGTPIRMTVRKDEHGKRRVIELDGT